MSLEEKSQQDGVLTESMVKTLRTGEVAIESEAVEPPKVEEVKSEQGEQIEKPVLDNVEQVKSPQNQTPPQPQIQEKIIHKTDPNIIQKLLTKARAKIQERKQKKLNKIMTLFETKPEIANKDIQKLLRTSRVSAFRYLNILESQNRIKQVGNTGKSVFYTKI